MGTFQIGRFAVKREAAVYAVLFVVGLGIGLGIARLVVGEPRVTQVDYAALVARIYDREHSTDAAVERLQAAGIPSTADGVARLAQSLAARQGADPRDVQSLRDLARDMGQPVETAPSPAPGSRPIWILSLLVFLFVLGLGSLLAVRILGIRLPSVRLPGFGQRTSPNVSLHRYNGQGNARVRTAQGAAQAASPTRQPPVVQTFGFGDPTPARPNGSTEPVPADYEADAEVAPEPVVAAAPANRAAVALQRSKYRFRSSYYLGDDPYDEIHPIPDRRGETMVGACGVSGARRLAGAGPARFWGFTAWVQDYVGADQQLKAVGLVSKWAYLNLGDEIDEWLRTGQIDELKQVEPHATIQIETNNLIATLVVQDFEYGEGAPPDSHFARLAAQFDVDLRLPAEQPAPLS